MQQLTAVQLFALDSHTLAHAFSIAALNSMFFVEALMVVLCVYLAAAGKGTVVATTVAGTMVEVQVHASTLMSQTSCSTWTQTMVPVPSSGWRMAAR